MTEKCSHCLRSGAVIKWYLGGYHDSSWICNECYVLLHDWTAEVTGWLSPRYLAKMLKKNGTNA